MSDELGRLRARVGALEQEHRRAFEGAQREADALFAQYQLSQLVASGGTPGELGRAVVLELVRLADADGGAIWLGGGPDAALELVAVTGAFEPPLPATVESVDAARALAGLDRVRIVVLGEERPATVLALRERGDRPLDADGLRVAQLARHELAVAFGGARLREALDRDRQELAAVVDGATDVIVQVDPDGTVVRLNPAGARLLGTTAEEAIGRSCAEVLGCAEVGAHPEDRCPLAEVISSGAPIGYLETAIRGAQGRPIEVVGGYSRAPGASGESARATAILRDVSAVEALEQLREGFVATVSHELRTPLALVRGYAETLLHFELDAAQQRQYVERIHEVTDRLSSLVGQILDVTQLDADPLTLERSPTSFGALLARLRGDLALSGADGRLAAEVPADLPPLDVDGPRIGRVLENLVGNALKYAPGDTPVVVRAAADGAWLIVTVDDEGVGIPEEERALVVEPFHRAWNVRESRIPGTGLGLYICRRLVEAHGGRLWLADRPDGGPGTRVGFSLPLLAGGRRRGSLPAEVVGA